MDYPSGLGRNPVQILALNVYVLSHHTLGLFHLKTQQEYLLYDQESLDTLKTGFGGSRYSTLFGIPHADISQGK
jgi:hypothetical protein